MHRGAWQATVHEVAKSQIVKQAECKLSNCDAGEDKSPLDCKEIKPINPKGNQSWIFIWSTGAKVKLKLYYFGHLMWRDDSLEKTLMLGKIEGRKKGATEDEIAG